MTFDLFVDTQSIYHEVRRAFGEESRVDFLQLPGHVMKALGERAKIESQCAYVVRRKNGAQSFADALQSFGYQVELLNQGSQDVDLTLKLMEAAQSTNCMVLVTCNARLLPLIEQLGEGIIILVFTVKDIFPRKLKGQHFIKEDWIWRGAE